MPTQLIKLFSTSTFGVAKISKPKKQKKVTLADVTVVESETEALAKAEKSIADMQEFEIPEAESQKSNEIPNGELIEA